MGKMWFNWKGHTQRGDIKFYPLTLTFSAQTQRRWEAIVLKDYILSKKEYDKFEWEIKIKEKNFAIQIGFFDVSNPKLSEVSICDYMCHSVENEVIKPYLVHLHSDYHISRCTLYGRGHHMATPVPVNEMNELKRDSRIKLIFNFTKKECHLYHNDAFIALIYKNIPEEIIPA